MKKVAIAGGGWSGCAAAVSAKKGGADVTLLKRLKLILGFENARFEDLYASGKTNYEIFCNGAKR